MGIFTKDKAAEVTSTEAAIKGAAGQILTEESKGAVVPAGLALMRQQIADNKAYKVAATTVNVVAVIGGVGAFAVGCVYAYDKVQDYRSGPSE